jgi:hypothetical protein
MASNSINSSQHTLTHLNTSLADILSLFNKTLLFVKCFTITLETFLTSIFLIGRVSFFFNDRIQPIIYHLAAFIMIVIIVKALIYVYRHTSKSLIIWTIIACFANILFITTVAVITANHYGPIAETITGLHRYHWYLVPTLYIIIILWLHGNFNHTRIYNFIFSFIIIISLIAFLCVAVDKSGKYTKSKSLYTDAVKYILNIKSSSNANVITVIGDFSCIRMIRGEFNVNLHYVHSSVLLSELNSGKYFSLPTMLILLYEKSNIDPKLDNILMSSGFSKTIATSTVVYQRFFEPGLLRLVQ